MLCGVELTLPYKLTYNPLGMATDDFEGMGLYVERIISEATDIDKMPLYRIGSWCLENEAQPISESENTDGGNPSPKAELSSLVASRNKRNPIRIRARKGQETTGICKQRSKRFSVQRNISYFRQSAQP